MKRLILFVLLSVVVLNYFSKSPTTVRASACGDEPCPTAPPDWAAECGGINFPATVKPGQLVQFTVQNFNVGARDWKALVATKTSEGSGIKLKVEAFNGKVSFNYPFHVNGSYLVWPRGKKSAPDAGGEREVMTGEVLWGAYADTCYGNCYRRRSGFRINFCPVPEISCANLGCGDPTCPLELTVPLDTQPGTYQINTYVFGDGDVQNFSAIGQCTKSVTVTAGDSPTATPVPTGVNNPTSPAPTNSRVSTPTRVPTTVPRDGFRITERGGPNSENETGTPLFGKSAFELNFPTFSLLKIAIRKESFGPLDKFLGIFSYLFDGIVQLDSKLETSVNDALTSINPVKNEKGMN